METKTRLQKAIEKIKAARTLMFYPHEDSACDCNACRAIDCLDKALKILSKLSETKNESE